MPRPAVQIDRTVGASPRFVRYRATDAHGLALCVGVRDDIDHADFTLFLEAYLRLRSKAGAVSVAPDSSPPRLRLA